MRRTLQEREEWEEEVEEEVGEEWEWMEGEDGDEVVEADEDATAVVELSGIAVDAE